MKKTLKPLLKIVAVVLAIALVITGIGVYMFIVKPNSDYNKYRSQLEVKPVSQLEGNGDYIHFLPTGSSDAILLESDGHFALVDCAEDSDNPRGFDDLVYDGYEQLVLDYLKAHAMGADGKVHLDFVLGTHCHSDHIGGFDTVIADDDVVIDRAYLKEYDETKINTHEVEAWDNKEVYTQMVDALNAKGIEIITNINDTEFTLGNFNISLYNVEYDTSGNLVGENDNAIGMLVEKNGTKVFLAADMDNYTGDEDKYGPIIGKVDLLKVGHHSYSHSTSTNWLKNLNPTVCVVTNDYEKTDKNTLRRITRVSKSTILVTGSENGVVAEIGDNGSITYYNDIV